MYIFSYFLLLDKKKTALKWRCKVKKWTGKTSTEKEIESKELGEETRRKNGTS